ncbi:hypothetical protein BD560DRAFT_28336 [Blakeslea trispora]|nr:hypothetical protein BD560DRAFT_28336 [Blakeslea trispora]
MTEIPFYFHQIFHSVKTLEAYLKDHGNNLNLSQQEQLAISELSRETVIACPSTSNPSSLTEIQLSDDTYTLEQILNQLALFILSDWRLENALVAGYELKDNMLKQKFDTVSLNEFKTDPSWAAVLKSYPAHFDLIESDNHIPEEREESTMKINSMCISQHFYLILDQMQVKFHLI